LYKYEAKELVQIALVGIIGKSVTSNKVFDQKRAYQSPLFNLIVDINTTDPIKCIPITNEKYKEIVVAVEFVNKKGNILMDEDVVEYLSKFVGYAWENLEIKETIKHENKEQNDEEVKFPKHGYKIKKLLYAEKEAE